jgi:hypothetical protein
MVSSHKGMLTTYLDMAVENLRRWDEHLELVKKNATDLANKIIDEHEANPNSNESREVMMAKGYLSQNVPTKEEAEEAEQMVMIYVHRERLVPPEETTEHNKAASEETAEGNLAVSKQTV